MTRYRVRTIRPTTVRPATPEEPFQVPAGEPGRYNPLATTDTYAAVWFDDPAYLGRGGSGSVSVPWDALEELP